MDDKYYMGFFEQNRLIAVTDLIISFPKPKTAYIGFFMTASSVQKNGVGSRIIAELCDALLRAGMTAVELGWVKGNAQAENFWHKNHFLETGIVSDAGSYTVISAKRDLEPHPEPTYSRCASRHSLPAPETGTTTSCKSPPHPGNSSGSCL